MLISAVNERIWNSNEICEYCRQKRVQEFGNVIEKEEKKYHDCFQTVCPGFTNVPEGYTEGNFEGKAIFFVLESMGGGREWRRKEDTTLHKTINGLKKYYIREKLVSFHQFCIRKILEEFENYPYIVTDIVKCFVLKRVTKNFRMAAKICSTNFLRDQLFCAKPKVIVLFGGLAKDNTVRFINASQRKDIGNLRSKDHGETRVIELADDELGERISTIAIYSVFPTANRNADRWIQYGAERKIVDAIRAVIG